MYIIKLNFYFLILIDCGIATGPTTFDVTFDNAAAANDPPAPPLCPQRCGSGGIPLALDVVFASGPPAPPVCPRSSDGADDVALTALVASVPFGCTNANEYWCGTCISTYEDKGRTCSNVMVTGSHDSPSLSDRLPNDTSKCVSSTRRRYTNAVVFSSFSFFAPRTVHG